MENSLRTPLIGAAPVYDMATGKGPVPWDWSYFRSDDGVFEGGRFFKYAMLHPFDGLDWGKIASSCLKTFLLCMFYGVIVFGTFHQLVVSGVSTSLSGIILGIVVGSFYYATSVFTNTEHIPVLVDPASTFAYMATMKLMVVPAAVLIGLQLLGFVVAGWITNALGWGSVLVATYPNCWPGFNPLTCTLVDTPQIINGHGDAAIWMTFFVMTFAALARIYNDNWEMFGEKEVNNRARSAVIAAIFYGASIVGLHGLGINYINSGLFLGAGVANNGGGANAWSPPPATITATTGDPAAWLGTMFVVAGLAAIVLYTVFSAINAFASRWGGNGLSRNGRPSNYNNQQGERSALAASLNTGARQRKGGASSRAQASAKKTFDVNF